MKSKWRAYALAGIFLFFAIAGLILHLASRGFGEDASAGSGPPFLLGIYTQSPSQPIRIGVELYYNHDGTFVDVFLNALPRDNVIMLSTQQDIGQGKEKSRFKKLNHPSGPESYYRYYAKATGEPVLSGDQRGYVVATFKVPASTLTIKPHEIFARLPLVGQDEDATQYVPTVAAADTEQEMYLNPTLRPGYNISDRTPSHYRISNQIGTAVQNLYWNPENLITEERILGVGERISGWNISDSPSGGLVDAGNFIWRGDYGLAGLLTAIDPSAAGSRDADEFFSGIALATAAAALIALLQECKDQYPFRKPQRPRILKNPQRNVRPRSRNQRSGQLAPD
ncbi:MAG: hypothetical protein ACRDOC_09915 [Streptosporangiaceae bacterium]